MKEEDNHLSFVFFIFFEAPKKQKDKVLRVRERREDRTN